jgi:hypothetical protein
MSKPLGPPPAKRVAARQPSATHCLLCRVHKDLHPRNPRRLTAAGPGVEPQVTPPESPSPANFPGAHFFIPGNHTAFIHRIPMGTAAYAMKPGDLVLQVLPSHIVVYRPMRSS